MVSMVTVVSMEQGVSLYQTQENCKVYESSIYSRKIMVLQYYIKVSLDGKYC